jgi:PTH2 family peptidyl-tRNA hydrolase
MKTKSDELVCYFVVNSELNMSPGKIAVSVGHVATKIALKPNEKFYNWYYNYNQKKVVLRGKEKDLRELIENGFVYVEDMELTEVEKVSLICVGLILRRSEAEKYIKRLQLL